ncbi:MAG: hypothetical protein IPI81_01750 [Flavobacteriales bacterium]|nr:hypothetical protein [Flavobacteriales bacterium]MCC6938344.1 hypothetical protein [Flavobacteriales bacterium]
MRWSAILLSYLLIGCAAPDKGGVRIIGHGGSGTESDLPMNSGAALLRGAELGIDGIELDAQLTADSILVAYHPADLNELTDCSGKVNALPWDEIAHCPVWGDGDTFRMVRLDSSLGAIAKRHPDVDFTLDCKLFAAGDWWTYMESFSDAIAVLDQQPHLTGRLIVECQIVEFLDLVKRKRPGIQVYLYATEVSTGIATAKAKRYDGITIDNALITKAQVAEAHAAGLSVTLFGVGSAMGHRDALGKVPDRLQTDSPSDFARH